MIDSKEILKQLFPIGTIVENKCFIKEGDD